MKARPQFKKAYDAWETKQEKVERIIAAKEGETFEFHLHDGSKQNETVLPPCEDKHRGNWYCITHQEPLQNNFVKQDHIEKGKHKMVWNCHLHGFEQP